MKKILHVINDEKIIDSTIECFESIYPKRNDFIIFSKSTKPSYRYIKRTDMVRRYWFGSKEYHTLVDRIGDYRHILIHLLDDNKCRFIKDITHEHITWIIWGTDLYKGLLIYRGFVQYRDPKLPQRANLISMRRQKFRFLATALDRFRLHRRINAITKIENIAAIESDYQLLKKYYPEFNRFCNREFFYYPIEAIIDKNLMSQRCSGANIILGNSASPSGNHIFALDLLKNIKCKSRISVPLSYGIENYKFYLLKCFESYKSLSINPILDYLPLTAYNKILLSCGNFIYANLRQEAVGNILVALYLGGKVFLDKNNRLYSFFKKLGLKIFSLDELSEERLNNDLSEAEAASNKKLIAHNYSEDMLRRKIKESFPL